VKTKSIGAAALELENSRSRNYLGGEKKALRAGKGKTKGQKTELNVEGADNKSSITIALYRTVEEENSRNERSLQKS